LLTIQISLVADQQF